LREAHSEHTKHKTWVDGIEHQALPSETSGGGDIHAGLEEKQGVGVTVGPNVTGTGGVDQRQYEAMAGRG